METRGLCIEIFCWPPGRRISCKSVGSIDNGVRFSEVKNQIGKNSCFNLENDHAFLTGLPCFNPIWIQVSAKMRGCSHVHWHYALGKTMRHAINLVRKKYFKTLFWHCVRGQILNYQLFPLTACLRTMSGLGHEHREKCQRLRGFQSSASQ